MIHEHSRCQRLGLTHSNGECYIPPVPGLQAPQQHVTVVFCSGCDDSVERQHLHSRYQEKYLWIGRVWITHSRKRSSKLVGPHLKQNIVL